MFDVLDMISCTKYIPDAWFLSYGHKRSHCTSSIFYNSNGLLYQFWRNALTRYTPMIQVRWDLTVLLITVNASVLHASAVPQSSWKGGYMQLGSLELWIQLRYDEEEGCYKKSHSPVPSVPFLNYHIHATRGPFPASGVKHYKSNTIRAMYYFLL